MIRSKAGFLKCWALFFFAVFLSGLLHAKEAAHIDTVPLSSLPPEVHKTIKLVKSGGPFPYPKDGTTFGNYERNLPPRARGFYHEYTVPTPGGRGRSRGMRRLVVGGDPALGAEYYYTNDHYASFRRIRE